MLLPNGHTIKPVGSCLFYVPNLTLPISGHVFPDDVLNTSLLSIAQLGEMGCVATFTGNNVTITQDNVKVLYGAKLPPSNLFTILLPLEAFALSSNTTIQYCLPHTHRSLKAERAIRTFKNHLIATLCTVAPKFPLQLYDELLTQVEICLNHLIPYSPNPLSAYAGIHGGAFDFAQRPIALVGIRVLNHDKPAVHASWAPHGVSGNYLGPAMQRFRSYRVWSTATKAIRIADTGSHIG